MHFLSYYLQSFGCSKQWVNGISKGTSGAGVPDGWSLHSGHSWFSIDVNPSGAQLTNKNVNNILYIKKMNPMLCASQNSIQLPLQ